MVPLLPASHAGFIDPLASWDRFADPELKQRAQRDENESLCSSPCEALLIASQPCLPFPKEMGETVDDVQLADFPPLDFVSGYGYYNASLMVPAWPSRPSHWGILW
jgi:hypothetical protein